MGEDIKKTPKKKKSPLIGQQAKAVPLSAVDNNKVDIDLSKALIDNIIDTGDSSQLDIGTLEKFTSISNSRDQIYQLIDTMAQDSAVSSILRTYAEQVCEPSDTGAIVWCESDDSRISKYVKYLLDIMNIDKNIFGWAYSLIKYGDVYIRLYRESDLEDPFFQADSIKNRSQLNETYDTAKALDDFKAGKNDLIGTKEATTKSKTEQLNEAVNMNIHKTSDPYSFYVEAVADPSSMFELVKFGKTYGYIEVPVQENGLDYLDNYLVSSNAAIANFKMKSGDVNIYQADDFVHAFLADNNTRFPEKVSIFRNESDYADNNLAAAYAYTVRRGKSFLFDSYKVWREKSLLESSALLNRVTRSSIVRAIQVEVGDMPKEQVKQVLRRVKELIEQKSAINTGKSMSEYTNPGPVENNVYLATHNGQGGITINNIGGDVDVKGLADLDWWNNKFYSSYGIPKQWFGWCLGKDTKIRLLDNSVHTIEELFKNKSEYIGKGILGCNSDGSLCPTKITNIMLTNKHAKLLRIWLDNNEYVDVTPDHRMMLRNGTFVQAKDLKENDALMPLKPDTEKVFVTKIEELSDDNEVYDLTVADDCHTFALDCGIFVHNCDDGAGFNGGTSLSITSSVFSKGVERVQNALLQAITDIINLFLLSNGYRSWVNNFTLKMKKPATQEEIDYRNALTNRLTAISNTQGLFTDIEDKARRLAILKYLVNTLNYGSDIANEIQGEIDATKEQQKKDKEAAEQAEAEAAAAGTAGSAASTATATQEAGAEPAVTKVDVSETETPAGPAAETEIDLGTAGLAAESLSTSESKTPLNENNEFDNFTYIDLSEDLPSPADLDENIDFTKNK